MEKYVCTKCQHCIQTVPFDMHVCQWTGTIISYGPPLRTPDWCPERQYDKEQAELCHAEPEVVMQKQNSKILCCPFCGHDEDFCEELTAQEDTLYMEGNCQNCSKSWQKTLKLVLIKEQIQHGRSIQS